MKTADLLAPGWLYVLSDPRVPGIAKIGMTNNGTPELRCSDYGRKHGYRFEVYSQHWVGEAALKERCIHRRLWMRCLQLNTENTGPWEIYRMTPADAEAFVRTHCFISLPYQMDLELAA